MKLSSIALLGASTLVAAQPHVHKHAAHHHIARHASPIEVRDVTVVTETAPGPVETIYELNGQTIPYSDVEAGLRNGRYVLVGGDISSAIPTTSATPTPSKSVAVFFEKKPTTTSTPEPVTPTPEPTTSSTPAPVASTSAAATSSGSSSSGGDVTKKFESGTIDCSVFPSAYGAVPATYLNLGGWTGIQRVPGFSFGISTVISTIDTAISGESCTKNSFCSYQCPAGYQKSQWPEVQGATGQSIGGLYCNSAGKLVLTNTDYDVLCIEGTGGVTVKNEIGDKACICRTDYPGTESETVALETQPGQEYPLTCPDALTYYQWQGSHTSAQYYINPSGAGPDSACTWNSPGSNLGNYSPLNAGVGRGTDGVTYISLFYNHPSNTDGKLDFDVKIVGGNGDCKYIDGIFYSNGEVSATGCTVGIAAGQEGSFVFYHAS
ncbi:hypothetical protein B0O99DRAFT_679770 [Bisporella sp. PMI_857]|nr:hypothetical protein B0O99DRAFT_679770 [Bisporella sp. PMI_857]